jgi:hypothetical protein
MIIRLRINVSDYERFAIAYHNDRQEISRSEWNKHPRLATRAELLDHFANAHENEGLHISDEVPNFNDDGTTYPLFTGDEDDGE